MPVRTIGTQKRKTRRKRAGAAVAVVVVGTVGGVLIADAVASGSPAYITAEATTAGVSQTLPLMGVVEPVSNVQADFQVGGTVSAVDVSMGQQVTAGQQLATLDASSLQLAVSNDQAILTAAEARLTADEENQASAGSSSPNSAATASSVAGSSPGIVLAVATFLGTEGHGGSTGSLTADQQAVVAGQHTVDLDVQASDAAFRQAQMTCSAVPAGSGSSTSSSTSTTSTTSTTPTTSTSSTSNGSASAAASSSKSSPTSTAGSVSPGGTGSSAACVAALGNAEQAAAKANSAEQALATAESSLAQLLSKQAAASPSKSTGSSTGSPSGHSSINSGTSGLGASGSGTSRSTTANTDTPQQLASDQATIDSDEANLVVAQQDLSDAVLTAPISGMVAAVSLTPNQTVTAGSTTDAITVISPGTYEANATLTTAQVSELTQGDAAQITINGVTGSFDGTVTRIGPVEESNGNYTYPLVIAMDAGGQRLPAGADAQLTVDLHSVSNAVVVPTSAVHTNGSTSYVLIVKGGSEQEQPVTVGVVGSEYTQITSGLTKGATVILANLSTKVPSSNTNTSNNAGSFRGSGTGAGGAFRAFTGGGGFVGRGGGGGG
jgi:multidrug efflux pump subunit AcrA (membrane-fusion protein)